MAETFNNGTMTTKRFCNLDRHTPCNKNKEISVSLTSMMTVDFIFNLQFVTYLMFMLILTKYFRQSVCYCACNKNLCNVNDPANDKNSCLFGVRKNYPKKDQHFSTQSRTTWNQIYMCKFLSTGSWCAHSSMAAHLDFPTSHPDHNYQLPGENPKKYVLCTYFKYNLLI